MILYLARSAIVTSNFDTEAAVLTEFLSTVREACKLEGIKSRSQSRLRFIRQQHPEYGPGLVESVTQYLSELDSGDPKREVVRGLLSSSFTSNSFWTPIDGV